MPDYNILSSPESLIQSANNDSIIVVSSDNATATGSFDYKYIAEIYSAIGSNSGSLIATLVSFPDPVYGYGVFNLKSVTSTLVSYDFAGYEPTFSIDSTGFFHTASNSYTKIDVDFGESFYDITGDYNENLNVVSTNQMYYINSAISYKKFTPEFLNSYAIDFSSDDRFFLQERPNSFTQPIKAYNKLRQWLYYFNGGGVTASNEVDIITFGSDPETPIGTYRLFSPYNINVDGVRYISTGVPQLAALSSSAYTVIFGDDNIINDDVESYAIFMVRQFASPLTFCYQIYDDCSKYSPLSYRVFWLNELGGFDSFLFNKMQITTVNKTQTPYKKLRGTLNSDGGFTYNTYDPGIINFYTQTQESYKLSTDFLTDTDVLYLKGLFSSPAIFLEDHQGKIISVTVNDNSYLLNKVVNQKIYSLAITFDAAVTNQRQLL